MKRQSEAQRRIEQSAYATCDSNDQSDRAGQPIVGADYHESIPPHRTPIEGLYLANTTQIYPEDRGQNYSIRQGQRVARLAVADASAANDA